MNGFPFPDGIRLSVNVYAQFAVPDAFNRNVERAAESPYAAEGSLIPLFGKTGSHVTAFQSGGADAEETFRNDAAVESTFGGKMALTSFGPCFDGIGHMFTQQTDG